MHKFLFYLALAYISSHAVELNDACKNLLLGNNFNQAIEVCQKAIEENPKDLASLYFLGVAYSQAGYYSKAIQVHKLILENTSTDFFSLLSYISLGDAYSQMSEAEMAILYSEKALALANQQDDSHYIALAENSVAMAYRLYNEHNTSIKHYQNALNHLKSNHPQYTTILNNIALSRLHMEDFSSAYKGFNDALVSTQTTHNTYVASLIKSNMAITKILLGEEEKALELLKEIESSIGSNDNLTALLNTYYAYLIILDVHDKNYITYENKAKAVEKQMGLHNYDSIRNMLTQLPDSKSKALFILGIDPSKNKEKTIK